MPLSREHSSHYKRCRIFLPRKYDFFKLPFFYQIDEHLSKNCQHGILPALKTIVNDIDDNRTKQIWEQVFAICVKPLLEESESIQEFRASQAWMSHVLDNSTKYLHKMYAGLLFCILHLKQIQVSWACWIYYWIKSRTSKAWRYTGHINTDRSLLECEEISRIFTSKYFFLFLIL